jgi:hypothetical protein
VESTEKKQEISIPIAEKEDVSGVKYYKYGLPIPNINPGLESTFVSDQIKKYNFILMRASFYNHYESF